MTETEKKIIGWLAGKDTGLSSESLAFEFLGAKGPIERPYDPADLGRCLRLIRFVPEVRACVDSLAKKHRGWEVCAKHWDEWAALMAEEVGLDWEKGRQASRTYDRMERDFSEGLSP